MSKVGPRAWKNGTPSRARAATSLSILIEDLPEGRWDKATTKALASERPAWLAEARKRRVRVMEEKASQQAARLDAWLAERYPDIQDEDSDYFGFLFLDPLTTFMERTTGCTEHEAEAACSRRWPLGMERITPTDAELLEESYY